MKLSVIGAGSFGTAVAVTAARAGNEVLLWAHDPHVAEEVNASHTNGAYLQGIPLSGIRATNDLREAATFSDTLLMMVPSHHFRRVLRELAESTGGPVTVVSGTKGIENDTLERMGEISAAELGGKMRAFATLSGPTFALELAKGHPTAAVIASRDAEFAKEMQRALSSEVFRLYYSDDVIGVELAAAVKNVIAIGAGVVEGLGLGYNTTAALITRGLHEITKLGIASGGRLETFAGLAGMGDLVLTCTGALSRNRRVGVELGKGKKLDDILAETNFVAEGVKTSLSVRDLSERHQIEMPIATEMYRVLYEGESPKVAITRLMTRSLKAETAR